MTGRLSNNRIRVSRRTGGGVALAVTLLSCSALVLTGCGASESTSGGSATVEQPAQSPSEAGGESSTDAPVEVESSSPPQVSSAWRAVLPLTAELKSRTGWSYRLTVSDLPVIAVDSDVTQSPPGRAQPVTSLTGAFDATIEGIDQGRQTPVTTLRVAYGYVAERNSLGPPIPLPEWTGAELDLGGSGLSSGKGSYGDCNYSSTYKGVVCDRFNLAVTTGTSGMAGGASATGRQRSEDQVTAWSKLVSGNTPDFLLLVLNEPNGSLAGCSARWDTKSRTFTTVPKNACEIL